MKILLVNKYWRPFGGVETHAFGIQRVFEGLGHEVVPFSMRDERNFETPYNENLILSSATGAGGLGNGILGDTSNLPLSPGRRNQFNFGFQQSLGSHLIIDGDYFYKRTNNAYDFNVLFNTSVTFPISCFDTRYMKFA